MEMEEEKRKWKRCSEQNSSAAHTHINNLDDGCIMHIFSFLSPIPDLGSTGGDVPPQFYRVEPEVTLADLSCYRQTHLESVESYLLRFKTARFKCKIVLSEAEYVRIALNGLGFEMKKFYGTEFRDLFELSSKASHYERLLAEEQDRKTVSKGTYYRDSNYEVAAVEAEADPDVAEIIKKEAIHLQGLCQDGANEVAHPKHF